MMEVLPSLSGTVIDLGGGRPSTHDSYWPDTARRLRIDILERHLPDIVGNAMGLPLATGSADAVVASHLLEHLPDPGSAIREVRRVLRPGGIFLGVVPFMFSIHGDPHDYFRFTHDGLKVLMSDFTSVTIEPYGNAGGAAFNLLAARSRTVRALTPLARSIHQAASDACPEGYQFRAIKG